MSTYSNDFDAYLYTSIVTPLMSYCYAQGYPITLEEIWACVSNSSPDLPVPTCPQRLHTDGRVCARPLAPGQNVCKSHLSPIQTDRPLCSVIRPANKGGHQCGRPVFKTKDGTLLEVCQYHRFKPPTQKRKAD